MSLLSKVRHVLRTEGAGSLFNRSQRYLRYRLMRARMDSTAVVTEWESLKNAYAGQRAFLIGNGPSLNQTPLHLLDGEATMCFNRFDLMLDRLPWRPTFYTVIDDRVLLDTVDIVNRLAALSDHAFFPDIHPYCVDFRDRIDKQPNVHWLFLDKTDFSDRLPYCAIAKTVANVGIQILVYLGFTEIYLVGVDMSYSVPKSARRENVRDLTATEDDDESHFDPRYFGKGRKFHVPMLDETFIKFREARTFCEQRGVQVVNSTVGGKLEEFELRDMDAVLALSDAEKRDRFRELVESKVSGDFPSAWSSASRAPTFSSFEEVPSSERVFWAPAERSGAIIMLAAGRYVPLGPLEGRHLWIRQDLFAEGALVSQAAEANSGLSA